MAISKTKYFYIVTDGDINHLNAPLEKVIARLQARLAEVPKEDRHLVQMTVTADCYGDMEYDINYCRRKTEAELLADEAAHKRLQEAAKSLKEADKIKAEKAEKRLYQRLKKKYEG